jgi:hypothetical protein
VDVRTTEGRRVLPALVVLASVAILGPALAPGYTLIGDLVFTPEQSFLPWMAGLGGGLPRSVPQDAVVALLSGPVPGWVLEKLALVGSLVTLGLGMTRLLRAAGARAGAVAAVLALWSPYVAERLLIGHWSLLLAVSVLPWALVQADRVRDGGPGSAYRWLLVLAVASLTVTGGLLVLLVSAPVLLWRGTAAFGPRAALVGLGAALQLPWLVPAVVHPAPLVVGGADVFALRSEGFGALLTALGTGGVWDAGSTPSSRGTLLAVALTVSVLALAWIGRRRFVASVGRPVATVLCVAAGLGLAVALAGSWPVMSPLVSWLVEHVPGGGLLRDGQKWLAPWLILVTGAAGCGAATLSRRLTARTRDRTAGRLVLVGAVLLPVALLPDLAWGVLGRLGSVAYPSDWAQVRTVLATDPAPGDVVSLPWSAYRRFPWNDGRTVLDPAPRAMTRTVVVSGDLLVDHAGTLVVVPGDDPRAARIGAATGSPERLARVLADEGVGWVLVEVTGAPVTLPAGAALVHEGQDLRLYRLGPPGPPPEPAGVVAVVTGDAVAGVVVLGSAVGLVAARRRRQSGDSTARATGW